LTAFREYLRATRKKTPNNHERKERGFNSRRKTTQERKPALIEKLIRSNDGEIHTANEKTHCQILSVSNG
jgi:hypothetical protein